MLYPSTAYEIRTDSWQYLAMTEAGFNIEIISREYNVIWSSEGGHHLDYINLYFILHCVCGRKEHGVFMVQDSEFWPDYIHHTKVDLAAYLEVIEAMSSNHLRQDGYTEEQILKIREPFERHLAA